MTLAQRVADGQSPPDDGTVDSLVAVGLDDLFGAEPIDADAQWCIDYGDGIDVMTTRQIRAALAAGWLSATRQAWRDGIACWAPIAELPELTPPPAPSTRRQLSPPSVADTEWTRSRPPDSALGVATNEQQPALGVRAWRAAAATCIAMVCGAALSIATLAVTRTRRASARNRPVVAMTALSRAVQASLPAVADTAATGPARQLAVVTTMRVSQR